MPSYICFNDTCRSTELFAPYVHIIFCLIIVITIIILLYLLLRSLKPFWIRQQRFAISADVDLNCSACRFGSVPTVEGYVSQSGLFLNGFTLNTLTNLSFPVLLACSASFHLSRLHLTLLNHFSQYPLYILTLFVFFR